MTFRFQRVHNRSIPMASEHLDSRSNRPHTTLRREGGGRARFHALRRADRVSDGCTPPAESSMCIATLERYAGRDAAVENPPAGAASLAAKYRVTTPALRGRALATRPSNRKSSDNAAFLSAF